MEFIQNTMQNTLPEYLMFCIIDVRGKRIRLEMRYVSLCITYVIHFCWYLCFSLHYKWYISVAFLTFYLIVAFCITAICVPTGKDQNSLLSWFYIFSRSYFHCFLSRFQMEVKSDILTWQFSNIQLKANIILS